MEGGRKGGGGDKEGVIKEECVVMEATNNRCCKWSLIKFMLCGRPHRGEFEDDHFSAHGVCCFDPPNM